MNLSNKYYDLWECNDCYRLSTRSWFMATRLNSLLNYYPQDTIFDSSDEPVFKFDKSFLEQVQYIIKNSQF
jgi:hypothetical protein